MTRRGVLRWLPIAPIVAVQVAGTDEEQAPPVLRAGDTLTAEAWNRLVRAVRRLA